MIEIIKAGIQERTHLRMESCTEKRYCCYRYIAKKQNIEAHAVQPGKFIILICGEVAEVEESLKEGVEVTPDCYATTSFYPIFIGDIIPILKGNLERDKNIPLCAVDFGILFMVSCVPLILL